MIFDRLEVVEITSPNVLTYWLEYNCYYMPSICKNALEYVVSAANVGRVATDISLFAYDFNTKRSDYRRKTESCPSNWIDKHRCPEGNQVKSYRYVAEIPAKRAKAGKPATPEIPGYGEFWDNIGLEPGSQRVLASRLDAQGNLEESRIHYTCDEWPPATFVQGGRGAFTRCAAQRAWYVKRVASLGTNQIPPITHLESKPR